MKRILVRLITPKTNLSLRAHPARSTKRLFPIILGTAIIAWGCGIVQASTLPLGSVVGWCVAPFPSQSAVLNGLSNVIAVASGTSNALALKVDGTVVAWGMDVNLNQEVVPAGL